MAEREVILSAKAIATPHLLVVSGSLHISNCDFRI